LRRVRLFSGGVPQSFCASANRNCPVRTHLKIIVQDLHGFIVERVTLLRTLVGPDEGFVSIGKATATEIRHWIRLAPNDVVENPEPEVLENRADAKNVVIGADD